MTMTASKAELLDALEIAMKWSDESENKSRLIAALRAALAEQPAAMTESKETRNARVQDRYDELMREGKHGHYETLFRIVREELVRATLAEQPAPVMANGLTEAQTSATASVAGLMPAAPVTLTDAEIDDILYQAMLAARPGGSNG